MRWFKLFVVSTIIERLSQGRRNSELAKDENEFDTPALNGGVESVLDNKFTGPDRSGIDGGNFSESMRWKGVTNHSMRTMLNEKNATLVGFFLVCFFYVADLKNGRRRYSKREQDGNASRFQWDGDRNFIIIFRLEEIFFLWEWDGTGVKIHIALTLVLLF